MVADRYSHQATQAKLFVLVYALEELDKAGRMASHLRSQSQACHDTKRSSHFVNASNVAKAFFPGMAKRSVAKSAVKSACLVES